MGRMLLPDTHFNVYEYGAIGDGWTDDTDAIQSAIGAASAASGGEIYFPAGTYRATHIDLTGTSNLILRGDSVGRGGPVTIRTHSKGSDSFVRLLGTKNLLIERLRFGCYYPEFSGYLLDASDAGNSWGEDACLRVTLKFVTFYSASQGHVDIRVGHAYDWVVERSQFERGRVAVEGTGTSNTVRFLNNRFSTHYAEALFKNIRDWQIIGNTCEPLEGGAPGLIKFDDDVVPRMVTVSGNWCGDVTASGTWIEARGHGWTVQGNLLHTGNVGAGSESVGVKLVGEMNGLFVAGNWVYGNGILLDQNGQVVSNLFVDANSDGGFA